MGELAQHPREMPGSRQRGIGIETPRRAVVCRQWKAQNPQHTGVFQQVGVLITNFDT